MGVLIAGLLIIFICITGIRFNRNTLLIDRPLNDARYFKAYVECFRGETPTDVIRPASNWRMLVPYIASYIPLEPLTSLNITNQLFLLLSIFFLYKSLRYVGIDRGYARLGIFLFVFSFPTFYYTTIGYVDPGVMFFVSICLYAALINNVILLMLAFGLGFLAKEVIVVVVPFVTVYNYCSGRKRVAILLLIILILIYILESWLVRQYAYITPGEHNNLFWVANVNNIWLNVNRINSLLAPFLTLGIVGLVYVYAIIKTSIQKLKQNALQLATIAFFVTAIAIYGFSFITTYADGRPFWLAYYPLLLVGMSWLQKQNEI